MLNVIYLETPRISRACFCPTHADLVNILRKRIDRGERSSLITDNHILYKTAPWLFQHVRHVSFYEKYVWYYYVTRKQPPAMTRKADSSRPCRKVGGSGTWKTSSLKKVIDKKGVRVGSMHYASFQANVETKKDGIKTGWVMHEFLLDRPGFQELVLCRIKFRPGKDNAQYAPIFAPIVIGQPQPPPVETHQDPGTEHQGIMGQDSNYPLLNEDMGEYGQDFGDFVDNQCHYLVQETMDRLQIPMMMNQALNEEQEWNGYSSPSLAQQYFGQDMVPMTQHLDAQHQHFGSMDEHQGLGSSAQFFGESSGQQQNHILGTQATTYHSLMEEQHQDFGSSALFLAQNNQSLRQNNDLLAPRELSAQQQLLRQNSNLSLTQQQNQIFGEDTYLSPMEQQLWQTHYSQVPVMVNQAFEVQQHVPWSAQPYAQYNGQNNTLPTVPMTTQQQQDNTVRSLPAQLQLEEQDNAPLKNQTMEEQAAYLPMNQCINEPHGGIVGFL
ncbi:unnamed protein product [Brassica oleracea var. botrytis]